MTVSVAVRLGLEGGQAATRGVEDFGRKGSSALREVKRAASELPPHLVAVSRGVGAIKDSVDDLAGRAGAIGNVAGAFGQYGTVVAAAAVGIAAAGVTLLRAAEGAIAMGDAIADAAQKAGVSTDTLQELRYAVHAMGGEYEDADEAISGFTKTLGLAESGYSKALKPFKQLGFTQADLKGFKSADDALKAVADRIADLGKETERQAISEKLGLGKMIPLLREGADGMAVLRKEAHDTNFVMGTELVAAAGDANDRLEDLDKVISVELASALVDGAPLIISYKEALAEGAKGARDFITDLSNLKGLIDQWVADNPKVRVTIEGTWKWLNSVEEFFQGISKRALQAGGFDKGRLDQLYGDMPNIPAHDGGALDDRRTGADGSGAASARTPSGSLLDAGGNGDAAKAAAAAERERKKQLDARQRTTAAIAAAEARELAAQRQYAGTLEDMLDTELKALDEAEKRRIEQIDIDAKEGKLDATKVEALKQAERDAFVAEREVAKRKAFEDTATRRLADEKRLAQTTGEILSLASAGARTAEERRKVETEMLDLQQSIVRKETQRELDKRTDLSDEDRAKILSTQDRLFSAQRAGLDRDTMGPLEAYRDSLIRTNGEVRESLQSLAVDGFKTLNDGLVSVIMNAGSLGDTFGQITDMIVAGIARVVYQIAIIGPMIDALTKASSGGGWLGKLAGAAAGALGGSLGSSIAGNSAVAAASAADLGGANLVSQLGKSGFSFPRATGGPVYRGDVRPIDEYGIERFARYSGDGYMVDAARTAQEIRDQNTVARSGYGAGGGGPIAVALANNSPMPLQATARETTDGNGGRKVEINLTELIDSRVARGQRALFDGNFDTPFQRTFGVRRRLNGG
jgi:hypothetical protein